MPKMYEYACTVCDDWESEDSVREELLGNLETPSGNLMLRCKVCGHDTNHELVPFTRKIKGGNTGDMSPYKGHALG